MLSTKLTGPVSFVRSDGRNIREDAARPDGATRTQRHRSNVCDAHTGQFDGASLPRRPDFPRIASGPPGPALVGERTQLTFFSLAHRPHPYRFATPSHPLPLPRHFPYCPSTVPQLLDFGFKPGMCVSSRDRVPSTSREHGLSRCSGRFTSGRVHLVMSASSLHCELSAWSRQAHQVTSV